MNGKCLGAISVGQAENVVALAYIKTPERVCSIAQHMRLENQFPGAKFAQVLNNLPQEDATSRALDLIKGFLDKPDDIAKRVSAEIARLISLNV